MKRALFRLSAAFWIYRLSGRTLAEAWAYSGPITKDYAGRGLTPRGAVEDDLSFWWGS